jgi:tetratricopeptide (TPR) repeat protein
MKTFALLSLSLFAQPHYEQANAHLQAGRLAEAEAGYRAQLKLTPNHVESLANLGAVLSKREKFSEAIQAYQRALKMRPDIAPLHLNLGLAYFKSRRWAEAAASFERFAGNRQAAQLRALSLIELERYDDAARAFESLLPSEDNTILIGLSTAYVKSNRGAEAQKLLAPMIARGSSAELQFTLGQAYFAEGQDDDALAAYRQAQALNANLPTLRLHIGAVFWRKKQVEEAIKEWRAERQQFPDSAEAAYTLGAALTLAGGDAKEAELLLRAALAKKPDHARANYQLAKLVWQQRKAPEALPCLEKAVKSDPELREAYYLLGRVYQESGRKADAARVFARVKEITEKQRSRQLDLFSEPAQP